VEIDRASFPPQWEVRLDKERRLERSDRKSIILSFYTTNNLPLVALLLRLDEGHEPYVATFATTADDVKKVMKFVQTHDLLFSVKSTGHCYSGNCMVNDR